MPKKKIDIGVQKKIPEMTIDEFKDFYRQLVTKPGTTVDDVRKALKERGADLETIESLGILVPIAYSPAVIKG